MSSRRASAGLTAVVERRRAAQRRPDFLKAGDLALEQSFREEPALHQGHGSIRVVDPDIFTFIFSNCSETRHLHVSDDVDNNSVPD